MNPARLTLDNPVFSGRLRYIHRSPAYVHRPSQYRSVHIIQDVAPAAPKHASVQVVAVPIQLHHAAVPAATVHGRQVKSSTLYRTATPARQRPKRRTHGKLLKWRSTQTTLLYAMAAILFTVGVLVSLNGWRANRQVSAQVSQLAQKATQASGDGSSSVPPATAKPSTQSVTNYVVAPDLPRYIRIPKIGVDARVLQVGIKKDGAIGTPSNVFDTAWYTGSAKPGQPGATFIDGHVSSWTTNGVFYNLKNLEAGDKISLERGDGTILNYTVVKKQIYSADDVDMAAALTSADPHKSGLNLMTCTGKVKPGTSEFNERVVVFAVQS